MLHRKIVIVGLAFAAVVVAMLSTVIVAEEPQKIDSSTPVEELKSLASKGNADAMLELGERLVQGQGVDTNAAEGIQWIQKAADSGNTAAWYDLGVMYSNGMGVTTDMTKAMEYLRKGAEKGNSDCQTSLGLFYQAGERIPGGVKEDPVEAVKWYLLAAEQNHQEAIQHLAMMNSMGMGIKQDNSEAIKWFRKGAELGNADCLWGLGHCYLDGRGAPQDSVLAYALYSASLDGFMNPEQKQGYTARCEALGKLLSEKQLKKAEPMIAEWKAKGKSQ